MRANPYKKTKHHRKPTSIGGTGGRNHRGNISWVPCCLHEAWHILFRNLPAPEILMRLVKFYYTIGVGAAENQSHCTVKITSVEKRAWSLLFEKKSLDEIAQICNRSYLDPDYKFTVTVAQVKRIAIKRQRK